MIKKRYSQFILSFNINDFSSLLKNKYDFVRLYYLLYNTLHN